MPPHCGSRLRTRSWVVVHLDQTQYVDEPHELRNRPPMIGNLGLDRWRRLEGLVGANEVVVGPEDRGHVLVVFDLPLRRRSSAESPAAFPSEA